MFKGGAGVTAAVQASLANRQLPRCDESGVVKYVMYTSPVANGVSTVTADVDWILAVSGGYGSSARSTGSDSGYCFGSPGPSTRSSPALVDGPQLVRGSRSQRSIRLSMSRLPWTQDKSVSYAEQSAVQLDLFMILVMKCRSSVNQ